VGVPRYVGVDDLVHVRGLVFAAEGQVVLVTGGRSHHEVGCDGVTVEDGNRNGCGHRGGGSACLPDGQVVVILVTMSETRSLAEAKAHFSELVARAGTEHERITVTVHGRPTAVLLAVEDLEALEETITVLSDPALLRSLGEADAELARGEGEDQKSLAAAMQARWASA